MLQSCRIVSNICFKYDDLYFPYIVCWFNSTTKECNYQVFFHKDSAKLFLDMLVNRGKHVAAYQWNSSDQAYMLTYSN